MNRGGGGGGKGGESRSGEPIRLALKTTGGFEMGAPTKKTPHLSLTLYGSMLGVFPEESHRSADVSKERSHA